EHGRVTVAPLFPFWLEGDLEYGRGDTVSWRNPHIVGGAWHRRAAGAPASGAATTWVATGDAGSPGAQPGLFDPTWGARAIPAPPYYYPQLTMRMLGLPVTDGLARAVRDWDPPPQVGTFELPPPDKRRVLMLVTTSEEMGAQ